MFPASAIGKKPTISAKTHDLKNKIFLGALTKTGADGDDHLAFFFTWPYVTVIDCIYMPSLHASLSLLLRTTLSPFAHVYGILSSSLLALTWLLWACSGHSLVYLRNDSYQP